MSIKQLARRMALTIGTLLAGAGVVAAQEASNIGEVIVTAQKRSETLVEVPMSVSVISGEALERAQAYNFQDLVKLVPGLSINTEHARRLAHYAPRHQYRRCRLDGRGLRQRRAIRLEQRSGERRHPLR